MAGKTDRTGVQYAFKKLSGRANTSNIKSDAQEVIGSNIQVGTQTIFGQSVPNSGSRIDFDIYGNTAEYVVFTVSVITGTTYDADSATGGGGDGSQSAGPHGYKLFLTGNYEALSSNPKKGSSPFTNGSLVHESLGGLQLIPPNFSQEAPNPFIVKIYEADDADSNEIGDEIPLLDEVDWTFDYYNGILFLQDYDSGKIPAYAKGFIYIGDYLSASIGGGSGGGGDGAASYVVMSATGSLSAERVLTPGSGINVTDAGAGSTVTLSVHDSVVATISGSTFTGATKFNSGLSGSLTRLTGGTSYLAAGSNVTITSASNGQITISSTGGAGGDSGPTFFSSTTNRSIFTTGSTAFVGGQSSPAAPDSPSDIGNDVFFFVSGAIDSRGSAVTGSAVFGGDVVISGTLSVNRSDAGGYSMVTVTTDGKVGIGTDSPSNKLSVGGNMDLGEYLYHKNDTDTYMRLEADQITFAAGAETLLTLREHTQDIVTVGDGGDVDFQVKTSNDDNTLFVQGSSDSVGIGLNAPATTLHVKDSSPGIRIQREAQTEDSTLDFAGAAGVVGASIVKGANTNDLIFNVFNGAAVEEMLRLGDHYSAGNRQVILLSGSTMHAGAMQPRQAADIAFFVSGAVGSRATSTKGTSVFGGDIAVSGSLHGLMGLSGSLTRLTDGSSYLAAGSNITILSASNGQITISSTAGGGGSGDSAAHYVVTEATGSLSNYKLIEAGTGITLTTGSNSLTVASDLSLIQGRNKKRYIVTASHPADSPFSTPQSNFSQVVYDPDLIDVYLNGMLTLSGTSAQVDSAAVDYTVFSSGSLSFAFDLNTYDVVDVVLSQLNSDSGGSGDASATYLVLSATGSLTNERVFTAGTGLSTTDGGAGNTYTVDVDDSVVATLTGSVFTGGVTVQGALTSSLGVGTLATNSSTIHISASNAPSSGSVLVAKSSTEAVWQQAIVFGEQPSGTKNGSNLTFALGNAVINNTDLMLFVNGLLQLSGSSSDYTLTGSVINFNSGLAPFSDDIITAIYRPSN